MSRRVIRRKVVRWESYTPPTEHTAFLECGHQDRAEYDDAKYTIEDKLRIELMGGFVECVQCGERAEEVADLKRRLKDLGSL